MYNKYKAKLEDGIRTFLMKLTQEAKETREAAKIIRKYCQGQDVSEIELAALKEQLLDILKSLGIGVPAILIPGGSVLVSLFIKIAKKYNINVLPSSFTEKQTKDENTQID